MPDADAGPSRFSRPGLVVEVNDPTSLVQGQVQAGRVRGMMSRGLMELTGATDETMAWGTFFVESDVVVVKVNPFGYPKTYTRAETVAEIVRGLGLVGVPPKNVIVYDRYTEYLAQVGYDKALPAGVRFASSVSTLGSQTALDTYDAATFVEFAKVDLGLDPTVAQNRRSYLCDVVSREATKVINVPVLKDHAGAGVTATLKNMGYGLFNNTARTHLTDNWYPDFMVASAGHPVLRSKVVLHVVDLLIPGYDLGPDPSDFTFDYASLMFGTDPVAMDRVCLGILDEARVAHSLPKEADSLPKRQPEYIEACGAAGMGVSNIAAIDRRKILI